MLGFLFGLRGGAEVGGVLSTVAVLPLTWVFIFIIHFISPRRNFLPAYLNMNTLPHTEEQDQTRMVDGTGKGQTMLFLIKFIILYGSMLTLLAYIYIDRK